MNLKNKRGFGLATLLVIIALILIIGGYIYYSNNQTPVAAPAPSATVPAQ